MKKEGKKLKLIFCVAAMTVTGIHSTIVADGTKYRRKRTHPQNAISLLAVGDDLIHDSIYQAARTKKGYNFNPIFRHTSQYIKKADLSIINQETIFVRNHYSGYPAFGSPYQVGDAVARAGFDVATQATNHAMDRGVSNIFGTYHYWRKNHPRMTILGIHTSQKDASHIKVIKKNGIRIAMLNYTYGLNGIRLPKGREYAVDELINPRKIRKDIRKARRQSDFVIVFPHWGTEYQYRPSADQRKWAQLFADEGVNLVIGTHPHVLEPCTTIKGKNGHRTVVYYSLGNFVSAQKKTDRKIGGMAEVKIIKDKKGVHIQNYRLSATVTHVRRHYFTVYKLNDYTRSLARANGTSLKQLKSIYQKATGHRYPYRK